MGQESEQNERRSEGTDHKVGLGGNMLKYFGRTVCRGSIRNGKTQRKLKIMGVRRSWIGAEQTP